MSLTVAFITARQNPRFRWWFDSLRLQPQREVITQIVVVDYFAQACDYMTEGDVEKRRSIVFEASGDFCEITHWAPPHPNVWGGRHRLTKVSWWHKSAALNTALCLCRSDWIAFVDDRCVLAPTWLRAVQDAIASNYAVAGAYEKRENMHVENGEIVDAGTLVGEDHRDTGQNGPVGCGGEWFYGCTCALPIEWALQVNGFEELLDGLGAEDTHFGSMLSANGLPIRFDPRMKVIQDRTPGECGPEMKRESFERYQNDKADKGHKAIKKFYGQKRSQHIWNIAEMRASVLSGNPFPNTDAWPRTDWFDGKPIAEFE